MTDEIRYMLGVIGVGFLVNYLLRALPFILFAGSSRALPRTLERFSAILSPVIIGVLIVYSYSGLAWKTAWPYVAGVVTVLLQLWKRNPLVSIVAGTLLYMMLLTCGCATTAAAPKLDAKDPSISVCTLGVKFGKNLVKPQDVPEILDDWDIPKSRTVHIYIEPDVRDLRDAKFLMACLAKAGYRRPVLVTKRHSEARATGKKKEEKGSKKRK